MKRIKNLFINTLQKREKTTVWNIIFKIGVILLCIGIVFTLLAIVFTMTANIENFTVFGCDPNNASVFCGILACTVALTGMFFIFCGKVSKK